MQRKLFYISSVLSIFVLIIGCASKGLKSYEPKSPDEEAIVSVLSKFEKARSSYDKEGCMAVLHDDAKLVYGPNSLPATKAEYIKVLPSLHPGWRFSKPSSIDVSSNTAEVKTDYRVYAYGKYWYERMTINLVKENNQWLIMSWIW